MPLPRRTIMTSTCLGPAHMPVYTLLWEGHAPLPRTDHVGAGGPGPGFVRLSVTGGLLVRSEEFNDANHVAGATQITLHPGPPAALTVSGVALPHARCKPSDGTARSCEDPRDGRPVRRSKAPLSRASSFGT